MYLKASNIAILRWGINFTILVIKKKVEGQKQEQQEVLISLY